ncbi:CotH kinase family protein [Youngiibacter fragilis]|uniref:Spore coat protein n=1 Tax=Youngiibacter fragilis 232.1 TaxID=994573 RepID=V7IBF8_9CLOT|nr:CotH kinase family protein [Youngiibacter fragilis]ETA82621.1 spore coat protein [Youngiibacter fragilis 232.1]
MMERAYRRNMLRDLLMSLLVMAASVIAILSLPFDFIAVEASEFYADGYFQRNAILEVDISIDDELLKDMLENAAKEEYRAADITLNGDRYSGVKIRTKGNSSLSSVSRSGGDRYSFKVELGDDLQLNLNNMYSDPSYMREFLSYEIMEKFGMKVPLFTYAKVSINGEYFGLYLAVESILEPYLERNFEDAGGDLYKSDGNTLDYIDDEEESYKGLEIKTNEDDYDFSKVTELLKAIETGVDLPEHLDVDSALRYIAANTALMNFDSYLGNFGHNYYLYEVDGKFSILPWDYNMSFGGFGMGVSSASSVYIDEPVQGSLSSRPLVQVLLSNEGYLEAYHSYLEEIAENYLSEEYLGKRIGEIDSLIGDLVRTDPTSFYTYAEYQENISDVTEEELEEIQSGQVETEMVVPSKNGNEGNKFPGRDPQGGMNGGSVPKLRLAAYGMAENIRLQLLGEKPSTNGGNGSSAGGRDVGFGKGMPGDVRMDDRIREVPTDEVPVRDDNDFLIAAGLSAAMAVFLLLLLIRKRRRFDSIT